LLVAVNDLRARGKTIVLITHRTSAIGITNKLLLLRDGAVELFGPTKQVLQALQEKNQKQMSAQAQAQPPQPPHSPAQGQAQPPTPPASPAPPTSVSAQEQP